MLVRLCSWGVVMLILCPSALADRDILADTYLDKLRGMWLGETLGNYAGRPTEGSWGIRGGNPASDISWAFISTDPWVADDDTVLEYMYMDLLGSTPNPGPADVKQAWQTHIGSWLFAIANRQARYLMDDGFSPPDTGSIRNNMHWYAIDSQITTESLGAAVPGMRQRAADLVGQFGGVTNDGYALHAAQFYGAMYAAAAFESNVENVVAAGIEVVPATSRTHEIIQDVQNWYAADRDDDGILDWRSTQEKLYDKYVGVDSKGRYRDWIESSVNLGLTTMAVLYGEGDFKETVKIGVLGGFDSDCNPATAGGLVGLIQGFSGMPSDLTSAASDDYDIQILLNTSPTDTTISAVALGWQAVAESMILAAGGTIDGEGAARTYHIPDDDTVLPPPERPDPAGPGGLVGQVLAAGGSVTASASIALYNPDNDRENLDAIIDGIRDVSYNGHLPYMTDDGDNPQPAGGDFYQLDFDRDVTFTSVIFSEGDIKWATINSNPKWSEPRGGYFLNLTVEVEIDGEFVEVEFLESSEALDPFAYFQEIELTFEPVVSRKIRIRGDAGGTAEFTSIVELEAFGLSFEVAPGDADVNGAVDGADLATLGLNWAPGGGSARWQHGDFDGDGDIDGVDLAALGLSWSPGGYGGPSQAPEPAAITLLAAGLAIIGIGRRRR